MSTSFDEDRESREAYIGCIVHVTMYKEKVCYQPVHRRALHALVAKCPDSAVIADNYSGI